MRLKEPEKEIIRKEIIKHDPDAHVFLFGSRADDRLRGGDIDILVISSRIDYQKKLLIRRELFKKLDDQKIDIVISADTAHPFVRSIYAEAVPL